MKISTTARTDWSFATTLLAIAAVLLLLPFSGRAATLATAPMQLAQAAAPEAVPMLLAPAPVTAAGRATAKAQPVERSVARARGVAVDFTQLDPRSGRTPFAIGVELFDGVIVTLDLERIEQRRAGNFTWNGRVRGYDGSQAILTVVDGRIAGTITLSDPAARTTATYQIQSGADGAHSLRQLNPSGFPSDHPAGGEGLHAPAHSNSLSLGTSGRDVALKAGTAAPDTGTTIDVMVVYSRQTAAAAGTAIDAQIQQAIDSANAAYANSGIATRLNLVHVEAMAYDESGDFNTDLDRLTSGSDGYMDNVATLRNTHAADLVSLFIENGQYCGLAWIGPSAGYGFSVINRGCASGNLTFAHELGHNFGALHDPYVDPGTSPYAFGHGYAVPSAQWRTVMAYNNACTAAGTSCTRIPYFSNPNLAYGSPAQPLGSASTSDNARVHNQNATTVANFRSSGTSGCGVTLSPSSVSVGATAASGSVGVTTGAGCAWGTASSASWLTVASGSGTSGPGTLNYAVAGNTGPARSGKITVGGVAFSVAQASGCSYALSSTSTSFASNGGSGSVTLTTGAGCAWTASSSASWLTVSSAKTGSGSTTVSFTATANTGTSVRSANLSIGGATFLVTEAAATASAPVPPAAVATLSATSINFGNQKVGTTSAAKTVTLTNTGGGTLTIGSLTAGGSNPGDFVRSGTGTCAVGTALTAGQSCKVVHTFTPLAASSRSAALAVGTNSGTTKLGLSGRGMRK